MRPGPRRTALGAADCNPQLLAAEAGALRDGLRRLGAALGDAWVRGAVLTPRSPTFDGAAIGQPGWGPVGRQLRWGGPGCPANSLESSADGRTRC